MTVESKQQPFKSGEKIAIHSSLKRVLHLVQMVIASCNETLKLIYVKSLTEFQCRP